MGIFKRDPSYGISGRDSGKTLSDLKTTKQIRERMEKLSADRANMEAELSNLKRELTTSIASGKVDAKLPAKIAETETRLKASMEAYQLLGHRLREVDLQERIEAAPKKLNGLLDHFDSFIVPRIREAYEKRERERIERTIKRMRGLTVNEPTIPERQRSSIDKILFLVDTISEKPAPAPEPPKKQEPFRENYAVGRNTPVRGKIGEQVGPVPYIEK